MPGPGQYDSVPASNINRDAPHYRIGTSERHDPKKLIKTPGVETDPGLYKPSQALTKSAIPNMSVFSQSRRVLHEEKSTPAPGLYEINEGAFGEKGVIIGQRLPSAQDLRVPAPGTYEADQTAIKSANPRFSMGKKLEPYLQKMSPGPGAYQQNSQNIKRKMPSYGFGSSSRPDPVPKLKTPGPGTYKLPAKLSNAPDFAMPNRIANSRFV